MSLGCGPGEDPCETEHVSWLTLGPHRFLNRWASAPSLGGDNSADLPAPPKDKQRLCTQRDSTGPGVVSSMQMIPNALKYLCTWVSGHTANEYFWINPRSTIAQDIWSLKGHYSMPTNFPPRWGYVYQRESSPFGSREAHGSKIRVWLRNGFPDANLWDFLWPLLWLSLFLRVKKKDSEIIRHFEYKNSPLSLILKISLPWFRDHSSK